jgi:hypothetical protein
MTIPRHLEGAVKDQSWLSLGVRLVGLGLLAGCGSGNAAANRDSGGTVPADAAAGMDSGDSVPADSAPGSDSGAIPADFASLCGTACPCQAGSSPPHLVGSYVGQGTTKETSNSLWAVNDSAQFVAHVISQPGDGTITGMAQVFGSSDAGASDAGAMSFALPLTAASIVGSGSDFTIYGTDLEDTGGGCKHGVKAVLSGTVSAGSTINGCMTLVFTSETQGSACTASEIANYPGTGARFQYTLAPQ